MTPSPLSRIRRVFSRRPAIALTALAMVAIGGGFTSAGAMVYAKALMAQALMQRAFAEEQRTGHPVRPWPWADSVADAQIAVPRLGIRRMVMASDTGQALAFGPGHVPRTAQAGDPGLAVYAGHRDTHFAFLGRLHTGDRIEFTRANGRRYTFAVTGAQVVRNDGLAQDPASRIPELALATCWPLDGHTRGPMRYVVRARLLSASQSPPASAQARTDVRIAAAAGGQ